MKRILLIAIIASVLAGCDDARIASINISKAAGNFEVMRRVVFMNGITDKYILEIVGLCSMRQWRRQLRVTCKNGEQYVKHVLGLSDNVTYFAEQLTAIDVSSNHYRVTFKPQAIIPDFDLRGSFEDSNHEQFRNQ